jgi:hypothetical protein
VSLRITKIDKQPVSHESADVATEMLDHGSASIFKPTNDAAQVLGIKLGRKASRADKIAKHHGKLASLGIVPRHQLGPCLEFYGSGTLKFCDRAQHPAAVPKQDPEVLKVLLRQLTDNRGVNAILGEALGVLSETIRY